MSSNSILSSGESEKRWVLALEKSFTDFNTPLICVFKTQSKAKPEAYAPHKLGLGPLHHLRPHLYTMHNHKLAAIKQLLPPQKLHKLKFVVDALLSLEPLVRACYDQYLDLNIETLAWIFAIDGLFLLSFLKNYPEMKHLAGDVLMLENQIPLVFLYKIIHLLQLDRSSFEKNLQTFIEDQSPLELNLNTTRMEETRNDAHLLHRMYDSIVNKHVSFTAYSLGETRILLDDVEVESAVQFLADRGLPGAGTAAKILSFAKNIPWEKISSMFKKTESSSPIADEIEIPSVSQMAEMAGIKFTLTNGGIRGIRFDDHEKKFHLPSIKLTAATSEIVLRNLVAYEAGLTQAAGEVAEYVDLMCGIIDTAKDVDILRKEGIIIIHGDDLDHEAIARIFNGISKSEERKKTKTDDKANVEAAINDVNTSYNSLLRVKVQKLVGKYAYAGFKVMSVLITIAVLLLLTLQAFCSVFGWGVWFRNAAMLSSF